MNNTFESETDQVRYTLHVDGYTLPVASHELGIQMVRKYFDANVMSQLVVERAYYSKWAYAMSQEGTWLYHYGLIWKRVN